jgi:hypothetical protein
VDYDTSACHQGRFVGSEKQYTPATSAVPARFIGAIDEIESFGPA